MINGVLNIDKPAGMTSHDVVDRVRRILGQRRVGHGGTLDPFATGVLLILLGSATKLMPKIHTLAKTYELEITLGATSTTDDPEGEITFTDPSDRLRPDRAGVVNVLNQFTGPIQQIPPVYAAIKVKGKKLYEYARAGQPVERKPRAVVIHSIDILAYEYPRLRLRVTCGAGTYMRALARDVGGALEVGGYASALRRMAIGSYTIDQAISLDKLPEYTKNHPEFEIYRIQGVKQRTKLIRGVRS